MTASDFKAMVRYVLSGEQFETTKARLQRILNRVGWTIHLHKKPSGGRQLEYVYAAQRQGRKIKEVYIAPLRNVDMMETGKIAAILLDKGMACYHAEDEPEML